MEKLISENVALEEIFNVTPVQGKSKSGMEISDKALLKTFQNMIQNSPVLMNDIKSKGIQVYQLNFKPETQKLLNEGKLTLMKAKSGEGIRAQAMNNGKVAEQGILNAHKMKSVIPYQLAVNVLAIAFREHDLAKINQSLDKLNKKVDQLIRDKDNTFLYTTKDIQDYISSRIGKIMANEDLSNEKDHFLRHLQFLNINIPKLIDELNVIRMTLIPMKTKNFIGTKNIISSYKEIISEFEFKMELIENMIKTYLILLRIYPNYFLGEKVNDIYSNNAKKYIEEFVKLYRDIKWHLHYKLSYGNTDAFIDFSRNVNELESLKNYVEKNYAKLDFNEKDWNKEFVWKDSGKPYEMQLKDTTIQNCRDMYLSLKSFEKEGVYPLVEDVNKKVIKVELDNDSTIKRLVLV